MRKVIQVTSGIACGFDGSVEAQIIALTDDGLVWIYNGDGWDCAAPIPAPPPQNMGMAANKHPVPQEQESGG